MSSASPGDLSEIRSFAQYLGGDATALADLRPSGDGAVFIPSLVAGVVARNYAAFTPVRNAATIWPTTSGEPTSFPIINDSESAVIVASAAATGADSVVSGNAPPTSITGVLMDAYKFSSKPVFFPRELVADATLNVLEEVLTALLARIARTQNLKYTSGLGAGSGEPSGFLTTATGYAAGAVPLDLDIALDLAYSVPALYRPQGAYMASDTTIKYLRKLKTGVAGDKRSLWKEVFEEGNATLGTPPTLHGYPIWVNNDLPSVATDGTFAGVSPLAFGDWKRFVIREVDNGAPYVYRYSVPALDGGAVIAFQRSDSKLIVTEAISKLTV
jgi:HK97 family phage major capsid protein